MDTGDIWNIYIFGERNSPAPQRIPDSTGKTVMNLS